MVRKYVWSNDQAEFYIVCARCYMDMGPEEQWTGSTTMPNWRAARDEALDKAQQCEMCHKGF